MGFGGRAPQPKPCGASICSARTLCEAAHAAASCAARCRSASLCETWIGLGFG